jgi:HSP20 family protein
MSIATATEEPFANLTQRMRTMRDPRSPGYYGFCPTEAWAPSVNLYETEHAYQVCVDLAGVDKDKINLVATGNRLLISGTRPSPRHQPMANSADLKTAAPEPQAAAQRTRVHLMEIDHGAFCREVELPNDVVQERIVAEHRNGLLWIELPKRTR